MLGIRIKQTGAVLLLLHSLSLALNASLMPVTSAAPETGDPMAQAHLLINNGHPEQAEKLVRLYLVSNPGATQAHFLLGYILFLEIQTQAASTSGSAAAPATPDLVALRERNARASLAEYTLGSQRGSPSAFDLRIVSLDYVLLDDYADADKWLGKALSWEPNDAQAWYYMGRIKFKEAIYAASIDAFHHVLVLRPQDIAAQDNLGLAYAALDQKDAALEAFQTAIAWASAQHAINSGPWLDLGDMLLQMGRTPEALPYLKQAVSMDATNPSAHEKLAAAYRSLEAWPQEQVELEQAVQLAPRSASLHFMLGQAYRKTGQPEKAHAEFIASSALHAQDATVARVPPLR